MSTENDPTTDAEKRRPRFGKVIATNRAKPLPSLPFHYVRLYNRNTPNPPPPPPPADPGGEVEPAGSGNAPGGEGFRIFYGDILTQLFELEPGQVSEWIPVGNLDQLYVRSYEGDCTVAFLASNYAPGGE